MHRSQNRFRIFNAKSLSTVPMVLPNLHGENVRFTGTRSPEQPFGEQPPFDFHANDSSRRGMICIENAERKRERERQKERDRERE